MYHLFVAKDLRDFELGIEAVIETWKERETEQDVTRETRYRELKSCGFILDGVRYTEQELIIAAPKLMLEYLERIVGEAVDKANKANKANEDSGQPSPD